MEKRYRDPLPDKIFYAINYSLMGLLLVAYLYPIVYIVSASFSDARMVAEGRVFLWPVKPTLEGYAAVFRHRDIMRGFRNSLVYTLFGTFVNLVVTMACAYPLARKDLPYRRPIMLAFAFTMLFSGGMIPGYLIVSRLGMLDTIWALVIPGAMSVYNMIIARTFIESSIPG